MLEFLFQILGEFLLQAVGEFLLQIGLHAVAEPFRRAPNPWLAALGYAFFGAVVGGLSLLVFAHNLVPMAWRTTNLIATPLAMGVMMSLVGAWRTRRGQLLLRIDRFAYGYVFALTFALVRFYFAA